MGRKILELKIGYIADVIIEIKKKRFNEDFTTEEEVELIRQCIEKRVNKNNDVTKFTYAYPKKSFNIVNGVITKVNNDSEILKASISDEKIVEMIYDEDFIYLCLCEIMINKLYNSIDHTCFNCSTECCGKLNSSSEDDCFRWSYDFKKETQKSLRKIL